MWLALVDVLWKLSAKTALGCFPVWEIDSQCCFIQAISLCCASEALLRRLSSVSLHIFFWQFSSYSDMHVIKLSLSRKIAPKLHKYIIKKTNTRCGRKWVQHTSQSWEQWLIFFFPQLILTILSFFLCNWNTKSYSKQLLSWYLFFRRRKKSGLLSLCEVWSGFYFMPIFCHVFFFSEVAW